jgi:hypothetical protein
VLIVLLGEPNGLLTIPSQQNRLTRPEPARPAPTGDEQRFRRTPAESAGQQLDLLDLDLDVHAGREIEALQ